MHEQLFEEMCDADLIDVVSQMKEKLAEFAASGRKLDMSRGKPGVEQLDLSDEMLYCVNSSTDFENICEMDVRNYGGLPGIKGARELMGSIMAVPADNVMVLGNSSLTIMYELISHAMTHGIIGSEPWCKLDKVRFLCPSPGYDRHFAICEHFGIEMVNIDMTPEGPDMDKVESLVADDPSIKGIWCVPQYSNPQGYVYSDETVKRFAALKPAATDFRIFWDNAYAIHHLHDDARCVLPIWQACEHSGNIDIFYEFASTSKVTFAGGGIAAVAASEANIKDIQSFLSFMMIGPDKINQLRHVVYFAEPGSLQAHMRKQAQLIAPKFEIVLRTFERELDPFGIGEWTSPDGGYFITFEALPGCATRIVELAKETGVTLTGAGATYPYGHDPEDKMIRIAPTYPSVDELKTAAEVFCTCVKIASAEVILRQRAADQS